jgi:hypothetical protein
MPTSPPFPSLFARSSSGDTPSRQREEQPPSLLDLLAGDAPAYASATQHSDPAEQLALFAFGEAANEATDETRGAA